MTLNGIEYPCSLEKEQVENPESEILIKAKLLFAKRKLFGFIQELQIKTLEERKTIYKSIQKLDKELFGA